MPVQSPTAPSSQTSPLSSLATLKKGGNEVSFLAILLSWESEQLRKRVWKHMKLTDKLEVCDTFPLVTLKKEKEII